MASPNSQQVRHQIVPQNINNPHQVTLQLVQSSSPGENEALAVNWLTTNFETVPINGTKGALILAEIYQEYVKHSVHSGRRNVLQGPSFNSVIRKVFPSALIHETTIEGITLKNSQLVTVTVPTVPLAAVQRQVVGVPAGLPVVVNANPIQIDKPAVAAANPLTSPILKAHLSAPPKANLSPTATNSPTVPSGAATNPAPVTTTSTSTLIKSLLANKLQNRTSNAVQNITQKLDSVQSSPIAPIVTPKVPPPVLPYVSNNVPDPTPVVIPNPVLVSGSNNTLTAPVIVAPKSEAVVVSDNPVLQQQPVVVKKVAAQPTPNPGQPNVQPVPVVVPNQDVVASQPPSGVLQQPAVGGQVIAQPAVVQQTQQPASVVHQQPSGQTFMTVTSSAGQQIMISTSSVSTASGGQSVLISTPGVRPGQPGQPQQQFILVRTVNPQGGVNCSQVRLILPASVLQQQRPLPPTFSVNGGTNISTNQNQIVTVSSNQTAAPSPAAQNQPNDTLAKAMNSSFGPASAPAAEEEEPKVTPSNVKSSPLLNVLLDKGKLPTSPPTQPQQPSVNTAGTAVISNNPISANPQTQPGQKMYILTTKQGVPIQTIQNVQQPNVQHVVSNDQAVSQTGSNQLQIQPQQLKNGSKVEVLNIDPKLVVSNVNTNMNNPQIVNCVSLTNGETTAVISEKSINDKLINTDLSPIKDIQKAVDEGGKLMKRSKDGSTPIKTNSIAVKKVKLETAVTSGNIISKTITANCTTAATPMNGGTGTIRVQSKSPVTDAVKTPVKTPVKTLSAPGQAHLTPPKTTKTTPSPPQGTKSVISPPAASAVVSQSTSPTKVTTPPKEPVAAVPIVIDYRCEWVNCNRFVN